MKVTLLISLIIVLTIYSCWTESIEDHLNSISNDSLYIAEKTFWYEDEALTINFEYFKNMNPLVSDVLLMKIDKNVILEISTSAIKTSNDSIYLFQPPDNGGNILIGKLINGQIESRSKTLDKKKILWNSDNSFFMNDRKFVSLNKVDIDWLKEVISKYAFYRGKDSLTIILSGP